MATKLMKLNQVGGPTFLQFAKYLFWLVVNFDTTRLCFRIVNECIFFCIENFVVPLNHPGFAQELIPKFLNCHPFTQVKISLSKKTF